MPGPLKNPRARRRNKPLVPTPNLSAAGREGPSPRPPAAYALGKAGKAWWTWAWKLPQACAWSDGDVYALARRASLEDDLVALQAVEGLDFLELMDIESLRGVRTAIQRVAALATGRLQIIKEMRELDDRFGLTAKAMAALHWSIAEPTAPAATPTPERPDRRLRAVDPVAAAV